MVRVAPLRLDQFLSEETLDDNSLADDDYEGKERRKLSDQPNLTSRYVLKHCLQTDISRTRLFGQF